MRSSRCTRTARSWICAAGRTSPAPARSSISSCYTPHVTREQLFLRSGHLPLYAANQFPAMAAGEGESEDVRYRVKPMNCPMHILVYASQQRSYRDLPIRLAEIAN